MLLAVFLGLALNIPAQTNPPVYVVLFTHIEDNTPAGDLNTPQARTQYLNTRNVMIEMAKLAQRYNVPWSLQPDWKVLQAALQYEDAQLMQNTGGKNFLRYLRESLNVTIDPHSHERIGYNYTDVAHLLNLLGTGGSTVIGGHVWDASLPQFQNWDRFRLPVRGIKYPTAVWRGDILMGSGTPNHVNDPYVTGVWRPKDRDHYFVDDPNGNIACVGQYKGDIATIPELVEMYRSGKVSPDKILTSSTHIQPLTLNAPGGLQGVEDSIIKPLVAMRDRGEIVLTDFTSLIQEWRTKFNGKAHIYDAKNPPPSINLSTDDDGDGHTGAQELLAGTDPFEARSVLCLSSLARSGAGLIASWSTVPGRSYLMQSATNFPGPWVDVITTTTNAAGSTVNLVLPIPTNQNHFYRVRLISP
jgi:hypothetical protein